MTVLLKSLHLNGHTLGFHPDLKVRKTLYSVKVLLSSFYFNGHTLAKGFLHRLKKLELP